MSAPGAGAVAPGECLARAGAPCRASPRGPRRGYVEDGAGKTTVVEARRGDGLADKARREEARRGKPPSVAAMRRVSEVSHTSLSRRADGVRPMSSSRRYVSALPWKISRADRFCRLVAGVLGRQPIGPVDGSRQPR